MTNPTAHLARINDLIKACPPDHLSGMLITANQGILSLTHYTRVTPDDTIVLAVTPLADANGIPQDKHPATIAIIYRLQLSGLLP